MTRSEREAHCHLAGGQCVPYDGSRRASARGQRVLGLVSGVRPGPLARPGRPTLAAASPHGDQDVSAMGSSDPRGSALGSVLSGPSGLRIAGSLAARGAVTAALDKYLSKAHSGTRGVIIASGARVPYPGFMLFRFKKPPCVASTCEVLSASHGMSWATPVHRAVLSSHWGGLRDGAYTLEGHPTPRDAWMRNEVAHRSSTIAVDEALPDPSQVRPRTIGSSTPVARRRLHTRSRPVHPVRSPGDRRPPHPVPQPGRSR